MGMSKIDLNNTKHEAEKQSFLSASAPSSGFYHRFFRVLVGVAMFLVALYATFTSALMVLFTVFASSSSKYSPSLEDHIMTGLWVVVLLGALLSLVAAIKIIFKSNPSAKDFPTTLCTILNITAVTLYGSYFLPTAASPEEKIIGLVILAAMSLLYLGSATMIIVLSRRQPSATSVSSAPHLVE